MDLDFLRSCGLAQVIYCPFGCARAQLHSFQHNGLSPGIDVPQEALSRHAVQARHLHRGLLAPLHGRPPAAPPRPSSAAPPRKENRAETFPDSCRRETAGRWGPLSRSGRSALRGGDGRHGDPVRPGTAAPRPSAARRNRRRRLRFRRSGARADVPGRTAAMMALRAAPRRARWLAGALLAPGAARAAPLAACVPAPPLPGPLSALPPARFASSGPQGPEGEGPQRRVVVVRITNPLAWLRTRFYYLLIRLYFDSEFSIEEFTRGAKQAFSVVSQLLSQRKLDLLEGLVSAEVLQMLKEKISSLSENHRDALAADMDAIMYTTEGDVRIYYDDDGRKFVSILMRFWYLNGANLSDEVPGETKVFQIVFGDESTKEKRHILTANYEFQREFTEGAKPDWTITRIEHPKLLE